MVKQHKRFVQNQVQTHFSQKEKKKYPFLKIALATFLQVQDETLAALPVFYGVGRHRLRVENYSSVQSYQEEKIVLLCPKMSVTIVGKALQIICLNEDEVMIEGYIEHIEYR